MSIQELEQQLLSLNHAERQRLAQLLTQSLTPQTKLAASPLTVSDAIAQFRQNMSPEELAPNNENIWQDVRDTTPVSDSPRW